MKLSCFGANRTTTGSKHLLEINGRRLLLECGLFQGRRSKTIEYNSKLPFDARTVDAVLLSHAHIDHSGLLPVLAREGFAGPIHATAATADLCAIMLLDSAHIQEHDAAFVSKKRAKQDLPPVAPLYTERDARAAVALLQPVAADQPVPICDGVTATWFDAGHILGSAMIALDIAENGRARRLLFSGDIGRGAHDLLRDPAQPKNVDFLIVESTYGDRVHEPRADVEERICAMILRALEQQGKIIIPAFSVGRTQQLLFTLHQLTQSRCIPELPTYVDSPLSARATTVFKQNPAAFNPAFAAQLRAGENPFAAPNVHYIQRVEESIALNARHEPAIIISASGMAEAGRIRHHLKNNIGEPANLILIVGWCAPHTLGARLASGHKEVTIFGEPHKVRAQVATIDAFSGHADKQELRAWAAGLTGAMRGIAVVHGEAQPAETFAGALRELFPQADVRVPVFGDTIEW